MTSYLSFDHHSQIPVGVTVLVFYVTVQRAVTGGIEGQHGDAGRCTGCRDNGSRRIFCAKYGQNNTCIKRHLLVFVNILHRTDFTDRLERIPRSYYN